VVWAVEAVRDLDAIRFGRYARALLLRARVNADDAVRADRRRRYLIPVRSYVCQLPHTPYAGGVGWWAGGASQREAHGGHRSVYQRCTGASPCFVHSLDRAQEGRAWLWHPRNMQRLACDSQDGDGRRSCRTTRSLADAGIRTLLPINLRISHEGGGEARRIPWFDTPRRRCLSSAIGSGSAALTDHGGDPQRRAPPAWLTSVSVSFS
jgi:hypothetical protein